MIISRARHLSPRFLSPLSSRLSPPATTLLLLPPRQVPLIKRHKTNLFIDKSMSKPVVVQHSHCGYCGTKFADGLAFPRECSNCSRKLYVNPIPVAVCVLPVDDGVLVVRRGIPPKQGQLAFPGGFIGLKETWQQAAVRELYEETGVVIDPVEIEHVDTLSAADADVILVFGMCNHRSSKQLEPFVPNNEATERLVITKYEDLAFDLHSKILKQFFNNKKGKK